MTERSLLLPPDVAAVVGDEPAILEDLTLPWSQETRTVLVTPAAAGPEGRLVVQWSSDRDAIARRLRIGRRLAVVAPELPIPAIAGGDSRAPVPYVVTRFVAGTSGRSLLDDDAGARRLGTVAGAVARDLAAVPTAGLGLPRRWASPRTLGGAAERWLARSRTDLEPAVALQLGQLLPRLDAELDDPPPVFAHGDLAPVNLIVDGATEGGTRGARDGATLVGLLDLERARIAHPLFDAAWWTWILRYHHPDRAPVAVEAFLDAAGLPDDPATRRRLDILAGLQCLEVLGALPRRALDRRREWSERVAAAVGRLGR